MIYDVVGPSVDVTAGLSFAADVTANPWWTLTGTLGAGIGFDVPVLDLNYQDANLITYSKVIAWAVTGPPLTITTSSSLPSAEEGQAYSATLNASGGTEPYIWSLAPGFSLPNWLSLSSTGVLSGTPPPAAAGSIASFTAEVTDRAGQQATAPFSVAVTGSNAQPPVDGSPIALSVSSPGQPADITFAGVSGERISAVISSWTSTDVLTSGCASLVLIDPNGSTDQSTFLQCNDGATFGIGPYNLPRTGTYTVRLELDTTATGSATLLLSSQLTIGSVNVNGPPISMTLSRPGQGQQVTFAGVSGERISAVISSWTSTDVLTSGCASLVLIDPNGSTDQSTFLQCNDGATFGIGPYNLPRTGTYTVRLELDTTATGSATLLLSSQLTIGSVNVNGPPISMTLSRPGQGQQVTFAGVSGERISAVISSWTSTDVLTSGCASLVLIDPNGSTDQSTFLQCNDGATFGIGPYNLPRTGTYTVRLELDTTATGSATLLLSSQLTIGSVNVNGPPISMTLSRPGQGQQVTFAGVSGERISAVISSWTSTDVLTSGCASLVLIDPNGSTDQSTFLQCNDGATFGIGPYNLPRTGTYTVRLELDTTATGSATLLLSSS